MESTQLIVMDAIQDTDALMEAAATVPSLKPTSTRQQYRSLSLSSLSSPLDALALACAAEQTKTDDDTDHGRTVMTEPSGVVHRARAQSSESFHVKTSQKPLMVTSHDFSHDFVQAGPIQMASSHSSDEYMDSCKAKFLPPRPSMAAASNYISQDFLQEIPSYISVNDVLCGRGGLTNHHPGNIFFRSLVRTRQEEYLRASKRDKANVAKEIVDLIRNQEPPGRFLKKVSEKSNTWAEIGDRKAREKTSQALREGAPELRGEISGKHADMSPNINSNPDMLPSPSIRTSSKDLEEQFNDNLNDTSQVNTTVFLNSFDANSDSMSTSSQLSRPRPRVVSSDSVRSAVSTFNSSEGMINVSGALSLDNGLFKRQKVRHRSFTDSGENNAIKNLCLPPPIRNRISSEGALPGLSSDIDIGKGPRLKLLKARFQRHEAD